MNCASQVSSANRIAFHGYLLMCIEIPFPQWVSGETFVDVWKIEIHVNVEVFAPPGNGWTGTLGLCCLKAY